MKTGLVISAGIHGAIVAAFVIATWNTTYVRQGNMVAVTRQVSLLSGRDLPRGRERPQVSSKPAAKTEAATEKSVKSEDPMESKQTGGGAKSSSGTGFSTGMTTDAAFPHGYYLELVEKKIEALFAPPTRIAGLVAQVHFIMMRNGRATEVKVVKPSGNAVFDQSAMRAIIGASPLPPLPTDFGANSLGITYIFKSE